MSRGIRPTTDFGCIHIKRDDRAVHPHILTLVTSKVRATLKASIIGQVLFLVLGLDASRPRPSH